MDAKGMMETLGVGLSRILRYSIGGFLFILTFALIDPCVAVNLFHQLGWQLTVLSAIVVGVLTYAIHRGLVIPVHHAVGIALLNFGEWVCTCRRHGEHKEHLKSHSEMPNDWRHESLSPTRWLAHMKVPFGRRMLAYSRLRREFFDEAERNVLNVAHAEDGIPVMISEAFLGATMFFRIYQNCLRWDLLLIFGALFVLSAISGIQEHRIECSRFKEKENSVKELIQGFLIEVVTNRK